MTTDKLLLLERFTETGLLEQIWLLRTTDGLALQIHEDAVLPLPGSALAAVFRRFGRPLDDLVELSGAALSSDHGRLFRLRYLPRFDVIARDYLVLCTPDGERLAELSTSVTAALLHLARAQAAARCEST
jgi:hypothetical protein